MTHPPGGFSRFQYPRRIECGCGTSSPCGHARARRVSVSSADRVWVWPEAGLQAAERPPRFSILGGSSVGVATAAACSTRGSRCFSILGGSSVGVAKFMAVLTQKVCYCFSILGGSSVGVAIFQELEAIGRKGFSILGGSSVGVALLRLLQPFRHALFQYPRRIECGCGSRPTPCATPTPPVSVSSADRVWVWRRPPAR